MGLVGAHMSGPKGLCKEGEEACLVVVVRGIVVRERAVLAFTGCRRCNRLEVGPSHQRASVLVQSQLLDRSQVLLDERGALCHRVLLDDLGGEEAKEIGRAHV